MSRGVAFVILPLLVILSGVVCRAQCSQGAIICETFGSGPKGPLPTGITNFTYRSRACPDDGEYTVIDTVAGTCHGQAWHAVWEDHTPNDGRGNMLVVNASYKPSEFYSQKAVGLCPGVIYEFSLWVINLNNVLLPGACDEYQLRNPVIAMRIEQPDGTLINEVVQPAVARTRAPVWVHLSMRFSIPTSSNDIVVKLINKGLGGCGNDLAIDDIGFRPVHPDLSIRFAQSPDAQTTVCADTRLTLTVGVATGYINPVYRWEQSRDNVNWTTIPGAEQATYTIRAVKPGRTYYRLRNTQSINAAAVGRAQCSTESNVLLVDCIANAPFSLGADLILCEGTTQSIQPLEPLPAGTTFMWSDQSRGEQLTVAKSGTYWLETSLNGCPYRDSIEVESPNCRLEELYVPDAFSPNNDNYNDQLVVRHPGAFITFTFRIYDRWGSPIFLSHQLDQTWDGTFQNRPCTEGVYAWTADYRVLNPLHGEQHVIRSGRVLLVR
ncbi:T9SS type B sorting domain-containing protein [Spirosoma taeanense]|uniref:T9SS type B sorting domain-containing protein n=1 Tax=Spirosoma taeanense TaxID=2735870 RepID=A0A6M5Y8Y0_9BACT|nr:gliding motility-associated C-terminal domain-containing protein [Spirosoma taeanense]QJW89954.1 T9SS type B sorting domain-containing protein [Spirosoma taeanense]